MQSLSGLRIVVEATSLTTRLARNITSRILLSAMNLDLKDCCEIAMYGSAVCAVGYIAYNHYRPLPVQMEARNGGYVRSRPTGELSRMIFKYGIAGVIHLEVASVYWSFYDPQWGRLLARLGIFSSILLFESCSSDSNESSVQRNFLKLVNVGVATYSTGLFLMLIPRMWDTGAILAMIGSSYTFIFTRRSLRVLKLMKEERRQLFN